MANYIEWTNPETEKAIRLKYLGKREDIERTAFEISRVWKSPITKIIKVDKEIERVLLTITRE